MKIQLFESRVPRILPDTWARIEKEQADYLRALLFMVGAIDLGKNEEYEFIILMPESDNKPSSEIMSYCEKEGYEVWVTHLQRLIYEYKLDIKLEDRRFCEGDKT